MGDRHVMVTGGNTSVPYVSQNTNNPIQGMIRVWGTDTQVYDGNGWVTTNTSYATVGLSNSAQEAIDWAQYKMQEERDIELLKAQYPQLVGAIEEVKQAKSKLDLLLALTKDYDEAG